LEVEVLAVLAIHLPKQPMDQTLFLEQLHLLVVVLVAVGTVVVVLQQEMKLLELAVLVVVVEVVFHRLNP
jgi:hypothetical protein